MVLRRRRVRARQRYRTRRPARSVVVYRPVGTPAQVRIKLVQRLHISVQATIPTVPAGPYAPVYLYFGFPGNVFYTGTNFNSQWGSAVGLPYPDYYPEYYNLYKSFIQLGMSWKVDFLRESFPSSLNTLCAVAPFTLGMMNPTMPDFPFQDYATWWTGNPDVKFKWQRGLNQDAADGAIVTIKGGITARKLHGEDPWADRFRSSCPAPGTSNLTVAQVNNALSPGSTAGIGTIAILQTLPSGGPLDTTVNWADLFVELYHDLYFFDPRPVPLSSL